MTDIEIPLADNHEPNAENAKVQLIIERGEARNRIREVAGPLFLIGANEDADLVLGDAQFAEYHAYICLRGNDVTLRHLGNAPEVTINGRMVRWGELRDGDRLRMGPYQFRLAITPIEDRHELQTTKPAATSTTGQSAARQEATSAVQKRWEAHFAADLAPKSDAWKKATMASQVVGWFDQVSEGK